MDTIFQRRSVRKFLEKKTSEEDIKRILRAGMAAPSCKASCEWVRRDAGQRTVPEVSGGPSLCYGFKDSRYRDSRMC